MRHNEVLLLFIADTFALRVTEFELFTQALDMSDVNVQPDTT